MKNKFAALHYEKTEKIDVTSSDDAQSILIKCYDELLKSIKSFQDNIVPNADTLRKKSNSFSKALTIIYTLQSSIDYEKDLNIAKNLFQIYEFTRLTLISEFKSCHVEKSLLAASALQEIRDTWRQIS
jgi:flagellar protein FliS